MSNSTEIPVTVPDIGDFENVDVIEILVAVGDSVAIEDPLVTLESDKATMDIPAPQAGIVAAITVAVGDKVSEGSTIVLIAIDNEASAEAEATGPTSAPPADQDNRAAPVTVAVPDIGDFDAVDVIEILVQVGDTVAQDDGLITLESDKATMDIPSPIAGQVIEIQVAIGDKVSEGAVIASVAPTGVISDSPIAEPAATGTEESPVATETPPIKPADPVQASAPSPPSHGASSSPTLKAYASPSIRKFARELGVDIGQVSGSGRKGRIVKSDVQAYVKSTMSKVAHGTAGAFSFPELPAVDFSKFGPTEIQPLSKIRRLTGENLHRSWITAPHVTQFDEADITELESFRKSKLEDAKEQGVKLTLLAFLVKAVVVALKQFPDFNASLAHDGESIVHKRYFHIGIAVNTERGLLVPVVKNADQKGLYELAGELRELGAKARDKKLTPDDMQGGCFTISSLGGVGGTAFTPIINVPEVAILGVSPAAMKPVYSDEQFVPRLMLPYALSYDHRVIDGVAGAQFTRHLGMVLGDIRHILL